jgi:hypothetical protein
MFSVPEYRRKRIVPSPVEKWSERPADARFDVGVDWFAA